MKRLAIILTLVSFMLCGCYGKKIEPRLTDISFDVLIKRDDIEYQGSAQIDALGVMSFEIINPTELCGMQLTLTPNTTKARFCDLSYDWVGTAQKGAIRSFYDIIRGVEGGAPSNGKNCVIENGEYLLTYSPAGMPISLEIPKENITAKFSSVTLKEE